MLLAMTAEQKLSCLRKDPLKMPKPCLCEHEELAYANLLMCGNLPPQIIVSALLLELSNPTKALVAHYLNLPNIPLHLAFLSIFC